MKNKKILAVGLCGAICLSLAGFTYTNALASDAPKNLASETENTSGVDILYHDTDGGQISTDGKNWISEADYEKSNAAPDVQWWTAEEYEVWMNEQKNEIDAVFSELFDRSSIANDREMYSFVARMAINLCRIMSEVAVLRALEHPNPYSLQISSSSPFTPDKSIPSDNRKDGIVHLGGRLPRRIKFGGTSLLSRHAYPVIPPQH